MSRDESNPRGLSRKKIVKLYVVYWGLFVMLAVLACFSVQALMNSTGITLIGVATFIVPGIATFLHVRKGKKDGVDDIARRMP